MTHGVQMTKGSDWSPPRTTLLCPSCDGPLNFETARDAHMERTTYRLSCRPCRLKVRHMVDAMDLIDVGSAAKFAASVCSDLFSQIKAYVRLHGADTEAVDELVNAGMIEPTAARDINDDAAIISGATF